MKLLAQEYDVTALCFYRRATRPTAEAVEAGIRGLSEIGDVQTFPIPQEHRRARLLWDHFRSIATGRVYTVFAYDSNQFTERLRQLLGQKQFDLVHLDSLDLSTYLPLVNHAPVACTHHNVESSLLFRRAKSEDSFLKQLYLSHQARLMAGEERRWCSKVDLNVVVSNDDAHALQNLTSDIEVVPNGVDTTVFAPTASTEREGIVFVGGYNWYPNRDAMEFFCQKVLPLVRSRVTGNLPITWIGRAPEEVKERYSQRFGVVLTGYVDDIRPIVSRAACYIAPLRVGGGSRLKILDAWAMGKAVVSTTVGCEGLDAEDGINILVRDDPDSFATAVVDLLERESLREGLERNARHTAELKYDWGVVGKKILDRYRELLNTPVTTEASMNRRILPI